MLGSIVCQQEHFRSSWFEEWTAKMGFAPPATSHLHRKVWEWSAIAQALSERNFLQPGNRALGFAVGTEPLVALFAKHGVQVDATDLHTGDVADVWRSTNQYADGLDALFRSDILDRATFDTNVRFFNADMNDLAPLPREQYDFLWSSCAIEHLGTLEAGSRFVQFAMDMLRPGGIACHTTEFNVSSQVRTVEAGQNVLYRRSDIEEMDGFLRLRNCCIDRLDFERGCEPHDVLFDFPPYGNHGRAHIKLLIEGHVATSMLLICRKFA